MRPFRVEIPQSELDSLRQRLTDTRWPSELPGVGWTRGVPVSYLKDLVSYWQSGYDWRAAEAQLNQFPQFTTEIDGANIHFLHIQSPEPDAVPLILTHGWPGSVVEFLHIIGPLTDPRSHGGDPSNAFHLVIPSIPGFGFSGPTSEPGWGIGRVATAFAELMSRLGYTRYIAQGGDVGSVISVALGQIDHEHVMGVHVNMLITVPSGDPALMAQLSESDQARLGILARFDGELSGYMRLQATRPQTLAYALTDSPVGQLAWIVEKFRDWTDAADVPEDAVDRDQMLTNAAIYWLTATAGSSAQIYFEAAEFLGAIFSGAAGQQEPIAVPLGVAVFPRDIFVPIRAFAEQAFSNIVHWSEFDHGGHFAAMEQPELFVDDLRKFRGSLK